MPFLKINKNYNQVSTILICGNTELLSKRCLEITARSYRVIVIGKDRYKEPKNSRISFYDITPADEKFSQLFDAYSVDVVWYFSGYTDACRGLGDETGLFSCVAKECAAAGVQKLVMVTSVEARNFRPVLDGEGRFLKKEYGSQTAYLADHFEEYAQYLAEEGELKLITLRAPYIAAEAEFTGYLGDLFRGMTADKKVTFCCGPESRVDFLSAVDLTELLILVSEEFTDNTAAYNVMSGAGSTCGQLEEKLKALVPELTVEYENRPDYSALQPQNDQLKQIYGFAPDDDVFAHLDEYYHNFRVLNEKTHPLADRLKKWRDFFMNHMLVYAELIIFGLIMELLVLKTGNSVYFKFIDLRLFYVLLLGSVHGMGAGIAAGVVAGISLVFSYFQLGITGTMLFYNIDYWLPFMIFLMTGLITGYIRSSENQKIAFHSRERELITEKYLFLNDIYEGLIDNKRRYKKQILSYQDSFGKIYESVRYLDSQLPEEIFTNGIAVLEKTLVNRSIAIYVVDKYMSFGRLVASSVDMRGRLSKSIRLSECAPMLEELKKDNIWKNTGFDEKLPMYACGIQDRDRIRIIIAIYKAGVDQQALYYANLFQVICNLIRISFLRALDYQAVIEDKKYYPDTRILYPEYFEQIKKTQQEMEDKNVASYVELVLDTKDIAEVAGKVESGIRDTDYCGCDKEGNIHILLTQTDDKTFAFAARRLDKMFTYKRIR